MRSRSSSHRLLFYLTFGLALIIAFSAAGKQSEASGPIRTVYPIDETRLSQLLTEACGFPVTRYAYGSMQELVWLGDQSQPVKATYTFPSLTFEVSANGHVLKGNASGPAFEYYYADGSFTAIGVGTTRFTTAPGSGVVFGFAGREVDVFNGAGDMVLSDFNGTSGNIAEACAYLAP